MGVRGAGAEIRIRRPLVEGMEKVLRVETSTANHRDPPQIIPTLPMYWNSAVTSSSISDPDSPSALLTPKLKTLSSSSLSDLSYSLLAGASRRKWELSDILFGIISWDFSDDSDIGQKSVWNSKSSARRTSFPSPIQVGLLLLRMSRARHLWPKTTPLLPIRIQSFSALLPKIRRLEIERSLESKGRKYMESARDKRTFRKMNSKTQIQTRLDLIDDWGIQSSSFLWERSRISSSHNVLTLPTHAYRWNVYSIKTM